MRSAALGWLALLLSGCTCGVDLSTLRFGCTVDAECGAGMVCRNKECVSEGAGGGSGGGAGGGAAGGGGGAACVVDGGTVQPSETLCADGKDNDCDGLADCADPQCNARSCGAIGKLCSGSVCSCSGNGGTPQTQEADCSDAKDNDCDGLVDCADSQCSSAVCGVNGRSCVGTACACSGNGGVAQAFESQCTDGKDNDCDALIDCADPTCEGRSCGAGCSCIGAAKVETACSGGADDDGDGQLDCADSDCAGRSCGTGCVCSAGLKVETSCGNAVDDDGDGMTDCADTQCCVGCPFSCEVLCNDGLDDDGNLLTDCADPKCGGRTCGTNGRVCDGASCRCSGNGGVPQVAETSCFDGFDNDCDGLADCADPSCQAQPCTCEVNCKDGIDNDCNGSIDCADTKCLQKSCSATAAASVCCSTGASATACKNLGTDLSNCGGCGLACASGRTCVAISSGAISSGRCDCNNNQMCPLTQTCNTICQCSGAGSCAAGQSCTVQICHYP